MSRWVWVVVGVTMAAALAYGVGLVVYLVAVAVDAAPLGLAGESTPTQAWVPPVVIVAATATFVTGAWRSVRRFRRLALPRPRD